MLFKAMVSKGFCNGNNIKQIRSSGEYWCVVQNTQKTIYVIELLTVFRKIQLY